MFNFVSGRIKSFGYAFKGLADLFMNHQNAQVHLLAVVVVVPLCLWLDLMAVEWALIVLCIVLVIALEAINSAIEYLADEVSTEHRQRIGKAKDIAAASVLVAAIGAVIVAGLIILPKLLVLWGVL